jgi:hypothetical protein
MILYGYYTTSSKFDCILKALFNILCSMQKSLCVPSMTKFMQQPLDLHRRLAQTEHGMGL